MFPEYFSIAQYNHQKLPQKSLQSGSLLLIIKPALKFFQFGIEYDYKDGNATELGEIRRFGCDTDGNAYHINDTEWPELSREVQLDHRR